MTASQIQRDVFFTFSRQLLAAIAHLLLVIVIARALGPQGNGHYTISILIPSLLVTFLSLGVAPATVYYVGRGEASARRALGENITLAIVLSLIGTIAALWGITIWGEALFPGIPHKLLILGIFVFPISLLLGYFTAILQGLEDFRGYNWTVLVPPYTSLSLVLIAIYWFKGGVVSAILAYTAGQISGVTVSIFFLSHYLRNKNNYEQGRYILRYKRRILSYGWRAHLSNVMAFVNYRADIFLVNFFLTPAATGIYVIAVQIAERLWMLSQAVSTVLLPRLSAMHKDPLARLRLAQQASRVVSGLTLLSSILVAIILYHLLVPVFGADYKDALLPFLWLLPGVTAAAGARVQSNCIAASGKPQWNMYVAIVVVTINIIGNIIMIPIWGITGAAMATSIAYIFNSFLKAILIKQTRYLDQADSLFG